MYNSDTVFVNVTPGKPILQSYQDPGLFTGFDRLTHRISRPAIVRPGPPGQRHVIPGPLLPNSECLTLMRPLLRLSQSTLKPTKSLLKMSRRERSSSAPSSPREAKRPRLEAPLTSEDYKNGIMLAPMVRSGARESLVLVGSLVGVCSRFCVLKCLRDFSL